MNPLDRMLCVRACARARTHSLKKQYQYETKANLNKLRNIGYKKEFYTLKEGISDYIEILESSDYVS